MIRLIIIAAIAFAAFWCYNNIDFAGMAKKTENSIKNEKTIKAVRNERSTNNGNAQSVMDDGYIK